MPVIHSFKFLLECGRIHFIHLSLKTGHHCLLPGFLRSLHRRLAFIIDRGNIRAVFQQNIDCDCNILFCGQMQQAFAVFVLMVCIPSGLQQHLDKLRFATHDSIVYGRFPLQAVVRNRIDIGASGDQKPRYFDPVPSRRKVKGEKISTIIAYARLICAGRILLQYFFYFPHAIIPNALYDVFRSILGFWLCRHRIVPGVLLA